MNHFHATPHADTCPDCRSSALVIDDVDPGDGPLQIAFICLDCGAAWPLTCSAEQAAIAGGDR